MCLGASTASRNPATSAPGNGGIGEDLMNRVVTGYDENGSPAIIRQGEPPTVIRAGRYVTTELWVTDRTPPEATGADASTSGWELEPPPGGTCFRIVEIAPGGGAASDGGPGVAGGSAASGSAGTGGSAGIGGDAGTGGSV